MITILPSIGLEALCCKCVKISSYGHIKYGTYNLIEFYVILLHMWKNKFRPCSSNPEVLDMEYLFAFRLLLLHILSV